MILKRKTKVEGRIYMKRLKDEIRAFCVEEDGIGVIEVVLILVVLIGLVIIFKKQITDLLESIFKEINNQSKEVY